VTWLLVTHVGWSDHGLGHVKKGSYATIPPHDKEGDFTPGHYRKKNVRINKSKHLPPPWVQVEEYMEELFQFINNPSKTKKYDLLKTAIAHHRFAWIHPFGNGNGRVVRLLTYAMLAKQGFNLTHIGHPTAIFCIDREDYYHHLSLADNGSKKNVLNWITYVLKGLKTEMIKIDRLLDYSYLKKEILLPALKEALSLKVIRELEFQILSKVVEKQLVQASDIEEFFHGKSKPSVSRQIKILIEKKMLEPEQ
jgi:Fic family protein